MQGVQDFLIIGQTGFLRLLREDCVVNEKRENVNLGTKI